MILPMAQRREHGGAVFQWALGMAFGGGSNACVSHAQEGIGVLLDFHATGQGGFPLGNPGTVRFEAIGKMAVFGFDPLGEGQVGEGVFVTAVNLGFARQRRQSLQRVMHLLRRTLEQAPTSRAKQGVAAKQGTDNGNVKGDMTQRMAGYVQDFDIDAQAGQDEPVVVVHALGPAGNIFQRRANDG